MAVQSVGQPGKDLENIQEQIKYTRKDILELNDNNTMAYVDNNDIIKADPNIYGGNFSISDKKRHGEVLDHNQKIKALKGYIKEISMAREM